MDEFELIKRYFDQHENQGGVIIGVGDDGAVLRPSDGCDQVQVIDTLVEGVHFPDSIEACDIGYRAVAVNISDVAAMGARPTWMTLALTLPTVDEAWLQGFSTGLFAAAEEYKVRLVGGDTTRGDTLVISVAATGEVLRGAAISRCGANDGDAVFVTGTLGDAAAGLSLLQSDEHDSFLEQRFLRPTARVAVGTALAGCATAMIDISDGFAGDLAKLLRASDVGASIEIDSLPLSAALRDRFDTDQRYDFALRGGDDYELCFTAKESAVRHLDGITKVGAITAKRDMTLTLNGNVVPLVDSGYRHFS